MEERWSQKVQKRQKLEIFGFEQGLSWGLVRKLAPETSGWLAREFLFFDADDVAVEGRVDAVKVLSGGALANAATFIEDGAVADARPATEAAEVWDWDATQMRADRRNDQEFCGTGLKWFVGGRGIENSRLWPRVLHCHVFLGKAADEDWLSVPNHLDDLTGGQGADVELHV